MNNEQGRQLEGVWHTGVFVFGNEYFFGGEGISFCLPGGTILGQPTEIVDLGTTEINVEIFHDYLESLGQTTFRPECYHLLDRNCNHFSAEVVSFLTSKEIPSKISNLSSEIMSTPFGQMIRPFIEAMHDPVRAAAGAHHFGQHSPANSPAPNPQQTSQTSQTPNQQTSSSSSESNNQSNAPAKSTPNKEAPKKNDLLDLD